MAAAGVQRGLKFLKLILSQSLGGEQVHRARARLGDQPIQHRQVVAQCFAASRGRDHHHVAAGLGMLHCRGLVRVQLADAAGDQSLRERLGQRGREVGELARRGPADGEWLAPAIPDRQSIPRIARWRLPGRCGEPGCALARAPGSSGSDSCFALSSLSIACKYGAERSVATRRSGERTRSAPASRRRRRFGVFAQHLADATQPHFAARAGSFGKSDEVFDGIADGEPAPWR